MKETLNSISHTRRADKTWNTIFFTELENHSIAGVATCLQMSVGVGPYTCAQNDAQCITH